MCMYMCKYVHVCTHVSTFVLYMCVCTRVTYAESPLRAHNHKYIHTHKYLHTHAHTRTRMHIYTTHTHMHIDTIHPLPALGVEVLKIPVHLGTTGGLMYQIG